MTQPRFALKLASAVIASGVSTLIAFTQYAHGESACGLSEAGRFHEAITAPTEEGSPAYFLRTSEAFIDTCPDRLEIREAHVIAARAAVDLGNAERAAAHYDAAIQAGARLKPSARMDQSVALMVSGNSSRAREARNIAVSDWLAGLDATDAASLSAHKYSGGTIYSVRYTTPKARSSVSALWLAVPAGDGLPAAILIRSAPQQAAWRAIRTGEMPAPLIVAEQLTCRKSTLLGDVTEDMTLDALERGATGDLIAYLKKPDSAAKTPEGEPLAACLGLSRMLHVPGFAETAMLR
ncbi:hypothetical protein [Hyphomonas sp.]|jgi:hypothetical protein|uniref:hypothetical protein n=1 Tax=Hyphomonas sp. TaxID=87 RepID=UPI0039E5A654